MLRFWIPSSTFVSDLVSSGGEYSILSVLAEAQRTVARDLTIRFDCIRTLVREVAMTAES